MLHELIIRNFAIIDDLNILFQDGLTILSGETGVGKSIVIQAVNLLLGSRASTQMVRTGANTAELEALFKIGLDGPVAEAMERNGYSNEGELLIRRIISRNDRHRTYINGRPVTLSILNDIVANLASISGQHAHQLLLKTDQYLNILDHFAGLMALRSQIKESFRDLEPLVEELQRLVAIRDGQSDQYRLLAFQRDEIASAGILMGEDAKLDQERKRLKNAELLQMAVYDCVELIYSTDGAAVERLKQAERALDKVRQFDPELDVNLKKITETSILLEDITESLRTYLAKVHVDESELERVEERIDILVKLKHKYGGSLEAVLEHLKNAELELAKVENIAETIANLEEKIKKHHHRLEKKCRDLSKKRKNAAIKLGNQVTDQLVSLQMARTRFQVSIGGSPAPASTPFYRTAGNCLITEDGIDQVQFLIAPNVGEELKPLSEIASGGELSRMVLALKVILAENDAVGTVVFDEVDAGIGGGTAEMVGRKLAELANCHQVICITHLPQIARFGDHHFRIEKKVSDGRTVTKIEPIGQKERVKELARMLGGKNITRKTMEHAEEMLHSS